MADRDLHKVSLYASDEAIAAAWKEMSRQRLCVHCNRYFTTFQSLGTRQCWQHPEGTRVEPHPTRGRQERYTCCKKVIPLPNFCGGVGLVADNLLMDQFSTSSCMVPQFTPNTPRGCLQADCTDDPTLWPSGKVDMTNEFMLRLRPVGGWPIGAKVMYEDRKVEVRSPPDPFSMIRIQDEGTSKDVHIKQLTPTEDWIQQNIVSAKPKHTLELMNEVTGKADDNVSYVDDVWRPWKHGVRVADIAGIIPYMLNEEELKREHIYGPHRFNERVGMQHQLPVIWRINAKKD